MAPEASVRVAASKENVPDTLNPILVQYCDEAVKARGAFHIALSGGSLPKFLGSLPQSFASAGVDPCWDKWHVWLADERCVAVDHEDSNLGAIQTHFLKQAAIPPSQVYGLAESLLEQSTEVQAQNYEERFQSITSMLDVAVLGFGPDGHTCSLFPEHPLLQERTKLVAGIDNSPKPPPKRITLTFRVLNDMTRHVVFCGAGASKEPILRKVFVGPSTNTVDETTYTTMAVHIEDSPAPFPCAMVVPKEQLTYVVDADAMPKNLEAKL